MPMYIHRDRNTQKELEVLRSFADYQVPPMLVGENANEEDVKSATQAGFTPEEMANADWERVIGRGIRITHGENWSPYGSGPGKGLW